MMKLKKKGFTLVEIMIVVAIIGLLAAIAIPNFATARANAIVNACRANLRQLQGAATAARSDGIVTDPLTTAGDLVPTYLRSTPLCPLGRVAYAISNAAGGDTVTCATGVATHTI